MAGWQRRSGRGILSLRQRGFAAVESDLGVPDTSFAPYLLPEVPLQHLDEGLKGRCLPYLAAGGGRPENWDTALRNAGIVLEERIRDVGGIPSESRGGIPLVNDVFGSAGTLEPTFDNKAELQGYRDLYAGVIGAIRNRYGHHFVDPAPDDGAAILNFVNLLLKMLEELRKPGSAAGF